MEEALRIPTSIYFPLVLFCQNCDLSGFVQVSKLAHNFLLQMIYSDIFNCLDQYQQCNMLFLFILYLWFSKSCCFRPYYFLLFL